MRRGLASRGPLRLALAVWCGLCGAQGADAVSAQESLLRAPTFAETLTRAEAASAAKQWAEAAALWEKVVEANPVRGGFRDSLAWARYNAKDYLKAAAAFEKVYELGEGRPHNAAYSRLPVSISDLYWQTSWPTDRRPWIAPLLYAPPTFDLYRANRDPAMEAILAYRAAP